MIKVRTSPHVHGPFYTPLAMLWVIIALIPATIWGCVVFSWNNPYGPLYPTFVVMVSIGTAVLTEYLLGLIYHEMTLRDLSAIVTGLLVGMNMPPTIPIYIPIIASAFAIGVAKWCFGGLGCNWMNPALAGRVFVFFSFTSKMSTFILPLTLKNAADVMSRASYFNHIVGPDAYSGATPLSILKTGLSQGIIGRDQFYMLNGRPFTHFAEVWGERLDINPFAIDAFFGNTAGTIGEVSAVLLICGFAFLMIMKVVNWRIPVTYLGTFVVLAWFFGGIPYGFGPCRGEILLPLFSGGLMLGALFMATDWVTTPTTMWGELIFGFGCGILTFIIRYFGSLAEGVSLAIILMNILTPTLDRIKVRKFGYVKPQRREKAKKQITKEAKA